MVDVVVAGAGNAALCAALAAAEQGASVTGLERAPREQRGGNSAFSGGAFRVTYDGVEDLQRLIPDLSEEEIANTDFGTYTEETYFNDLARLSGYHMDPDLAEILTTQSLEVAEWMVGRGVRFVPIYGRQAYKVDGRFRFWGGLTIEASGGGRGLMDSLFAAVEKAGVSVMYGARATRLRQDGSTITGIEAIQDGRTVALDTPAVILASGGFHANAEWRARYLARTGI